MPTSPTRPTQYYYLADGQRRGPVGCEDLKQLVTAGKLAPTDMLWQEGNAEGFAAGTLEGLFPAATAPPAPPRRRPAAVVQRRLFLSCVSIEFRAYRDLLAANLAQPGVELRRQEDFVNVGRTTLEKLDDYIRNCDAVIHLVGHAAGAYPEAAAVESLLASLPDFIRKLGLADMFPSPGLSYTQWEAWLALYHGKPLALYRAADVAPREVGFARDPQQVLQQQRHWERLEKLGRDRKEFASPYDLSVEVLRALPLLVPGFAENVRRGQFRDRNLLFAVLAMQDEILSREAFVKVCTLWAADTDRPIWELMQHEKLLSDDDRALIETRLERKLKARGGDVRQSLAESLGSDVRRSMGDALAPDLLASLPDRLAALGNLEAEPGKWRYRLTRTYGVGGLGVVSVAEDSALWRSVAVKQLRPERILDPMAVERFVREARITGRLQHPNIVPVYELGLRPDDQVPFYAMRFVGHRTLQNAIVQHYSDKSASPSERNVRFRGLVESLLSVANAIAFAHDQGVIHRDLKPENVMIGDFGEVILLDWGLAKRLDEAEPPAASAAESKVAGTGYPFMGGVPSAVPPAAPARGSSADAGKTQAATRLGSPAYMAPEQAAGRIDLHGKHTDIYGLGVTLYEVITGDVPFTGASSDELFEAIQTRELPDPRQRNPEVPAALAAICRKAMEKRPIDRYATAQTMADDIRHWLADEPVSAYREPLAARAARWGRKHKTAVAGSFGLVTAAAIALAISTVLVKHQQTLTDQARQQAVANAVAAQKAEQKARQNADAATQAQKLAEANEATARTQARLSLKVIDSVIFDIERGLQNVPGALDVRRRVLKTAIDGLNQVVRFSQGSQVDRDTAVALGETGDVLMRLGGSEKDAVSTAPRRFYEQADAIFRKLAEGEPRDARAQRDLAISYGRLGDVAAQMGQTEAALKYYGDGLAIRKNLAEAGPGDARSQRDVAVSYDKFGSAAAQMGQTDTALMYFQNELAIFTKLADADPRDIRAQRDLSISYDKLGSIAVKMGQSEAALKHYQNELAIFKKLADADPADTQAQRDLSVSYDKLGNVAAQLGRTEAALKFNQDGLAIAKKLVEADPRDAQAQRDLSVSYQKLGSIEAQLGQADAALKHFQDGLAIAKKLVEADPRDAQARRDMAVLYSKLGDVAAHKGQTDAALKYYQDGLVVAKRLADADPRDAHASRGLSISYDRLGEVAARMGQTETALKYYQDVLTIRRKLADADPHDALAQHDLAAVYNQLGEVAARMGRTEAALKYYQDDLAIRTKLAEADPRNAQARNDLVWVTQRIAYCMDVVVALGGLDAINNAPAQQRLGLLSIRISELARRGDLTAVAEAADRLRTLAGKDAEALYNAACGYSLCVRILEAPPVGGIFPHGAKPRELTADQKALRQRYVDLALSTLKDVIAAGYRDADHIRTDDDLIPLRSLPEFQKLLASIPPPAAGKKPP